MPLILSIALSHLAHRRRQTLVSILGVALGVSFFIGMSSMMRGFQQDFVARVIDTQPHVLIRDEYRRPPRQPAEIAHPSAAVGLSGLEPRDEPRGLRDARAILDAIAAMPGVAAAPTLSGQVLLRFGARDVSVGMTGIEPSRERLVSKLADDLIAGRLDDLSSAANGIILGEGVADKAGAALGDMVTATSPAGVAMRMKVVGIFSTGITAIDNFETYALLKKAQILQDRPDTINRIRLKLADIERADEVARRIETRFGWRTESWQEASKNVLGIFVIQNGIMYSTVSAILIVACFGIFNVISTVVFEKVRDIAILKSIGFAERDVRRIFVLEGLAVGVAGTACGFLLGYGMVEFMASLEFEIEGFVRSQGFVLDRSPWAYVTAGGAATASATLAAWLPARRAAKLHPVDIVRGGG
ncbi:MAG: ABC transporter permease [Alphaproteobacteria bacterium]|nr:ABC transporter permease [Alphaproteobacteria bacterium]